MNYLISGPYYSKVYKKWEKNKTSYYAGNIICKIYESQLASVSKIYKRYKESEEIYNLMIS
jgi:hypothetical protein